MSPFGGRQFELTCTTLRNLIGMAYKTSYIDGGGKALDNNYDIRVTDTDDSVWTQETVASMLRVLLAQRFHLATHTGKRELSGYSLTIAKGGPKLRSSTPELTPKGQKAGQPSANFTYPGHVQGRGLGTSGIASLLSLTLQAPVVDHTS